MRTCLHASRRLLLVILLLLIPTAPTRAGIWDDMKAAARAGVDPKVRGRVELRDGATLTCFEGVKTGYLGPPDLMSPGYTVTDPATGTVTARTAAIPTIIMLKPATVMSNDCGALAEQGLLTVDSTIAANTGPRLHDNTPCREVPADQQARYPNCVSFDPKDHCSALPVYGGWLRGQADLAGVCNSRRTNAVIEEEQAYQRSRQTTAPAGTPHRDARPAPVVSNSGQLDGLASDGAKVCKLRAALLLGLRDEALQFVRIDRTNSEIVMSEVAGGTRREVVLDANSFASRAMAAATDIAAGGVKCGVAFWDAEAVKEATTALSQPAR